ncbi:response regulator [Pseudomarimonas salicorniae]|uniref:Response regulator n=1 Tax=Pseudomarimonas salicorniae TaxID=2933270 RepID=A0ABT0GCY9_9GAMM|nr:response regulator [Lysobacter sp. CAU 1642]MCK7592403.1 response regulator [Lysobacter sp. CAU 1642]
MSVAGITRHISSDSPRIMVVDGSKVVRRMIETLLVKDVPNVSVISCETGAEAKAALQEGVVDLVTTALRLPDMDGLELAHYVREHAPQAYIPIIVVSGDVQERLVNRSFGDDVTDYFDKSLGFAALTTFIHGYVAGGNSGGGEVLYVEDSKVVAMATRRMLEKNGLSVIHVISVEDAIAHLETAMAQGRIPGPDIVLTDVYLKGGLTGHDLLEHVRNVFGYAKSQLPILVMTGDDNPANQSALLRLGANDLVQKPIEERLLVTKLLFQLRVGRMMRDKVAQSKA